MPLACLIAHAPDPTSALLYDDRCMLATCRRCGGGLFDEGRGWSSPLGRIETLRRPQRARAPLILHAGDRRRPGASLRPVWLAVLILGFIGVTPSPRSWAAGQAPADARQR